MKRFMMALGITLSALLLGGAFVAAPAHAAGEEAVAGPQLCDDTGDVTNELTYSTAGNAATFTPVVNDTEGFPIELAAEDTTSQIVSLQAVGQGNPVVINVIIDDGVEPRTVTVFEGDVITCDDEPQQAVIVSYNAPTCDEGSTENSGDALAQFFNEAEVGDAVDTGIELNGVLVPGSVQAVAPGGGASIPFNLIELGVNPGDIYEIAFFAGDETIDSFEDVLVDCASNSTPTPTETSSPTSTPETSVGSGVKITNSPDVTPVAVNTASGDGESVTPLVVLGLLFALGATSACVFFINRRRGAHQY